MTAFLAAHWPWVLVILLVLGLLAIGVRFAGAMYEDFFGAGPT